MRRCGRPNLAPSPPRTHPLLSLPDPFSLLAHPLFSNDLCPSSDLSDGLTSFLVTAESSKLYASYFLAPRRENFSYSGPSRASSVFFSRAVEDTRVSIRSRRETSSRWSRDPAGRTGPSRRLRAPSGPSPPRPRSSLAGRPWARDPGSPQTPESSFGLSLGPRDAISRSEGSNLGRTAALRAQRRLRSEKLTKIKINWDRVNKISE